MLINEGLIMTEVAGDSKLDILKEMAATAADQGKVKDVQGYIEAVLKREEEYSTAVNHAVAIPHAKTDAVNESFFMYGRVGSIDWKALDGKAVEHVFLIGVPAAEAGNTHLKILADLSAKLMNKEFRKRLADAEDKAGIMELLNDYALT